MLQIWSLNRKHESEQTLNFSSAAIMLKAWAVSDWVNLSWWISAFTDDDWIWAWRDLWHTTEGSCASSLLLLLLLLLTSDSSSFWTLLLKREKWGADDHLSQTRRADLQHLQTERECSQTHFSSSSVLWCLMGLIHSHYLTWAEAVLSDNPELEKHGSSAGPGLVPREIRDDSRWVGVCCLARGPGLDCLDSQQHTLLSVIYTECSL